MTALFDLKDHGVTVAESTAIYLPARSTITLSATRRTLKLVSPRMSALVATLELKPAARLRTSGL